MNSLESFARCSTATRSIFAFQWAYYISKRGPVTSGGKTFALGYGVAYSWRWVIYVDRCTRVCPKSFVAVQGHSHSRAERPRSGQRVCNRFARSPDHRSRCITVLGYAPKNNGADGKFHKVGVKVDAGSGERLRVSNRAGYLAPVLIQRPRDCPTVREDLPLRVMVPSPTAKRDHGDPEFLDFEARVK